MNNTKSKCLNTRQWNLYKLLKQKHLEVPNSYISCNEIMAELPNEYSFTEFEIKNNVPQHDTHAHELIRKDINAIRNSHEIDKIICSNSKGYKIATEKEAESWLKRIKVEALKKLMMYWKNKRSAESDNQMRLVFNKERDTIEVFD